MARKSTINRTNQHRSLITRDQPKSPTSEQYRTIRTNLQFSSVDKDLRSMLVTSSGPGEGKSLTTANLAVVFAQQGKSVLLVDADLRKPTVHYTFKMNNTFGLSNYLIGEHPLEKLVQDVKIPGLDVLSCGPIPPNPSELLGSKQMKRLLEDAKSKYDLIIFDTPPVLAVTDSQVLSNYVDGALLVVRSKQTENESAIKSKELLEQANANILGVVLNDKDMEGKEYYYGN
ncbi:capsular biosynthesis protein [Halalkalibacillus sediminis]|uniref:non-specific protein-tyrosine kinase n=1 Tax=Halalkalibacillus sediminis TaxID=2018042 RepID=A0A2I0QTY5_9BACI|nr:CpsD/CapB family tyrosine-protein kinase [Halalkalibacillus sediminis]PKR77803.1 capsular biosynthesis protein [Halalkalibacillus sediminis]